MSAMLHSPTRRSLSTRDITAWLLVSGVFIAVSLLRASVPAINEPHYLTKARAFAQPEWCEGDFFLRSGNAHYVFFTIVGPFTKCLSFETVAVWGRVLSYCLLGCGWNMVGRRLGLNAFQNVLAAAVLCGIGATGNFSGEWIIGGFEGKVPAYGFAVIGLAWWIDAWQSGRWLHYAKSGAALGAAVAWHPVVGLWFCIGIAASELGKQAFATFGRSEVSDAQRTWGQFLTNCLTLASASFVVALPGLIPAAELALASELDADSVSQANYIQVFWRLAHHLDPSTFPTAAWAHTSVVLLVCIVAVRVSASKRQGIEPGGPNVESTAANNGPEWGPLLALLAASGLISLVGILIGWHRAPVLELPDWQWRAALLKFYPFRFFDAVLPITTSFAIVAAWSRLPAASRWWSVSARNVSMVMLLVLSSAAVVTHRQQGPTAYSPTAFEGWKLACEWLRTNTSEKALVLGPRESFGLKWFAQRAEYVCFKDCPQDAEGILEWNRRLWKIHGWSESSYQDSVFDIRDTDKLHEETGITHILTRRLGPFEMPPVYDMGGWSIYEIGEAETE